MLVPGISKAEVTFDHVALEGAKSNDQMPLALLDRLQRVVPFADRVADESTTKRRRRKFWRKSSRKCTK